MSVREHHEFSGDERDRRLLLEAGASLSSQGFNSAALKFFGLKWLCDGQFRSCLADVSKSGLPVFMAPDDETLNQNAHLIATIFQNKSDGPPRRLAMCFDETYLVSTHQLLQTQRGSILAGGAHRPAGFCDEDESAYVIERTAESKEIDLKNHAKATHMLSFLIWDCTRPSSPTLETGAFPVLSKASKHPKFEAQMPKATKKRGAYEMLARVGAMLHANPRVRFVLFDNHSSHDWCRKMLLGQPICLHESLLEDLCFWPDLKTEALPESIYSWGYQLVKHGKDVICYVGGPQHVQKNFVEQLRSPLRTVLWGEMFCDPSALSELGLVTSAYVGSDAMSDLQAALW